MAGLQFSSGIDKGFEKDLNKMNMQMNQFSGNVGTQGTKIDNTFKTIGKTIGGIATVGAFAAAGKEIVDFSLKLGTALVEVATISDEVSENQGFYRDALIAMSTEQDLAASSALQLTEALYDVTSAGYSGAEGLKVLEASARAGTAGFVDASVAADGITTVLNAWGKSADEAASVSDIFFKTVEKGKTTFPELGSSIAKVAPLAAALGISFEEVSGAIATVTKQGTKTPEALTQIRAAMVAMNKVLGDGWTASMTFQEGLAAVAEQADGSQNKLKELLGTDEAVLAVLALTGENALGAAEDLNAMNNALGATVLAAEKVTLSTAHQLLLLKNNILAAFAPLGGEASDIIGNLAGILNEAFESGAVELFAKTVLQLVKAFAVYKVASVAQNQIQKLTIAQNRLQAITGTKVAKSTVLMAKANKGLAKTFKSLKAAFAANPLGLLVTGLTLALPLITKFIDKQGELNKINQISVDSINKYSASLEVEKDKLNSLFDQLKKTNPETEERRRLIEELKKINPEYTGLIDLETASEAELELARKGANDELERKIALQAKETATSDINSQLVEQIEKLRKAETKLFKLQENKARAQKENNKEILKYIDADIEFAEKPLKAINKTIDALKAERDEIAKYYDEIISPDIPANSEDVLAKEIEAAAKKAKKAQADAAKASATAAEKARQAALYALELDNQRTTNEILQHFGSTETDQRQHLDNLLSQQLEYLAALRKLTVGRLEIAKIDEQIIQARIAKSVFADGAGGTKKEVYPTAELKEFTEATNEAGEATDEANTNWKDTLELINGLNELVGEAIESFGGLDARTQAIASAALSSTTGLINMATAIKSVTATMSGLEKASVVLAVVSAALQSINAIRNAFKVAEEERVKSYVRELESVRAINVQLIEQNRLYEEGNGIFNDDRWGTALAGLSAYSDALAYTNKLEKKVALTQIRTSDRSDFENYIGFTDSYENILDLYPKLIKANGEYDTSILETILATEDLSDVSRKNIESLIEGNELAKDSFTQFGDYLSSIFKGLGDDAIDAFQTMYEGGEDAMTSLEGSFSTMIESFTNDIIKMIFIQPLLDQLNETVTALGENPDLTNEELQAGINSALATFYQGLADAEPQITQAIEAADIAAADLGFDGVYGSSAVPDVIVVPTVPDVIVEPSVPDVPTFEELPETVIPPIEEITATAGVVSAAITEETASLLVGRLGAMMISNQAIADNTDDMRDFAMQNLIYMKAIKLNSDYLPEIAKNTKETVEKLSDI